MAPNVRLLVATAGLVLLFTQEASLQRAKPGDKITEASIRGHMEFLAGDAMKGRGSGTEDEWRAAEYIGSYLRRLGLDPLGDNGGFVKRIDTGRATTVAPPVLSMGDTKLTHGREMIVTALGRPSTGPLVKFATGTQVAPGSVVLVPEGVTLDAATAQSAAVILAPETTQVRSTWEAVGSRLPATAAARAGGAPPPTRAVLSWEAYGRAAALPSGTPITIAAETKPGYTWNALGRLKGRDSKLSDEVILLSAHLDHLGVRGTGADAIFNGADDDASGSTAVLELAGALSEASRPKRTVIFAWFGSEETGGFGARNFLASPPVPIARIIANLEFEMIGNADPLVPPHTLWLTGYDCSTLGPDLAKRGARIVQDPHPSQGFFARSDNIQLARMGVVAQTISSFDAVASKTYHKTTDDVSTVDFAHMRDAIQSMLEPVRWLANSTYKPMWLAGKDPSKGGVCGARQGRGGRP
jgi:aminopeptidase YwaD